MLNIAFGMTMLLGWRQLAPYLEDSVYKLLGSELLPDTTIITYPFVVLWTLPFLGVAATVAARSFDANRQAAAIAMVPATLTLCSGIWLFALSDNNG